VHMLCHEFHIVHIQSLYSVSFLSFVMFTIWLWRRTSRVISPGRLWCVRWRHTVRSVCWHRISLWLLTWNIRYNMYLMRWYTHDMTLSRVLHSPLIHLLLQAIWVLRSIKNRGKHASKDIPAATAHKKKDLPSFPSVSIVSFVPIISTKALKSFNFAFSTPNIINPMIMKTQWNVSGMKNIQNYKHICIMSNLVLIRKLILEWIKLLISSAKVIYKTNL
jgi:hypothetical protein